MDDIPLGLGERDDSQLHPKHTIFLSHAGAQKAFVEQLYVDLKSRGQSPFFDQCTDSLPKGEVFADRILKAAKQCVVAVVVLSKAFLVSKWAMLELTAFVGAQQSSNPNLKLFPLFYKLEVSDLEVAEATITMAKWMEMQAADRRIDLDVWKNAVRVLARANGEVFSKYGGSKVKYRKAIVDAVCKLCRPHVESRVPSMVGRDRLCNIMEGRYELAIKSGVIGARILGLYGVSGMGKTFICKALCDHFSDEYFGRVCYVEYSDGEYLELLKLILEELTDIDERALRKIRSEEQANDSLKRFLPKQDVFLALDNVQDDDLDWLLLTCLSAKSKVVVTSRSLVNVQRVVGSQALCLPCPTLTVPDALKLFVQSTGCAQPLAEWTNEEMEILKKCIDLSLFENDNDLSLIPHSSERRGSLNSKLNVSRMGGIFLRVSSRYSMLEERYRKRQWARPTSSLPRLGMYCPAAISCNSPPTLNYPLVLEALETDEEMENLKKCVELSLSENDSGILLNSSEKPGYYNPLVLVAMGTTIKEDNALQPKQLMEKCKLIKRLQQYGRPTLSDVLRTRHEALTADEKQLFLDVALLYPIMNLGDVEFVDMLDCLMDWLEIVEGSPRREILHKLGKLKDFNRALNGHKKVHELFPNIYLALGCEAIHRWELDKAGSLQCSNKAIEILTLQEVSLESIISGREKGEIYTMRGAARSRFNDFKGALEDLQKANDFYPKHARIYQLLGIARSGLEQYKEALEALNCAIDLYPTTEVGVAHAGQNYADTFASRAWVKLQLNDLAGAKMDIDFASALDPHGGGVQEFRPKIMQHLRGRHETFP